jgi:UDP-N-acetylglucosamine diphosphorylase/glucosamine-1-phosphate N-acetyltransferase
VEGDTLIAAWLPDAERAALAVDPGGHEALTRAAFAGLPAEPVAGATLIGRLWDLIGAIRPALHRDVAARAAVLASWDPAAADVQEGALLVRREAVHLAPGAVVHPGAVLNATDGPIVIDRGAIVFENAVVRGPVYLGPKSQIKVGANVEGCAIGPSCKVGGEVHNCVFHSFSSKAHEGFLGDSYVGRWCNLGANSTGSNLKNNYGTVSLYNAATGAYEASGRQFLGQIVGDHSKFGINTALNTGSVIGVFCNLYGAGLHPRYVPAFTWGSAEDGYTTYRLDKALDVARAVMQRRDRTLSDAERDLLADLFERAAVDSAPAPPSEAPAGSNGAA